MRLLITGVSGLLGSNLAWLASNRCQVVGVLRGERVTACPGKAPFDLVQTDLTGDGQIARVLDDAKPDVVIHCAALTDVDRCEVAPDEAARINTDLPVRIAEATAQRGIQLIHISTDSVFDGEQGDYTEEDRPHPLNVYSQTKLDSEVLVARAHPQALIARVNFYGWSWQGRRSLSEWFYNNLAAGNVVSGFTDLVFCPLLVNDLADILLRMMERRMSGLYHVVSSESLSKYDFGQRLAREFGFDENLVRPKSSLTAGMKAPRSRILSLNCAKLVRDLGEEMPAQAPAIQRYADLFHQGYPRRLREMFLEL
jgi:dTDP-4-dehydrorhamnose reductase